MTTRQPQAPGVGKTAKRHDLETPATPGLTDSDLQQGDVQRLEAATQAVPATRGKAPGAPSSSSKPRRQSTAQDSPDPIEFIGGRDGGKPFVGPGGATVPMVDIQPWLPLIRRVATTPGAGGAVGAALVRLLTTKRRQPINPQITVIDRQELDAELMRTS